jgi:hypothetical protein
MITITRNSTEQETQCLGAAFSCDVKQEQTLLEDFRAQLKEDLKAIWAIDWIKK